MPQTRTTVPGIERLTASRFPVFASEFARLRVFIMASLLGCSEAAPCGPNQAVVSRVIDGDTVELEGGETVRYLLVDTPEVRGKSAACYGAEARDFNATLVKERKVELGYDEECRDRFGRLLAYVFASGRELNSLLVERGYACVLHIPPNGTGRAKEFRALEQQAKEAGRGLWGQCMPNSCR